MGKGSLCPASTWGGKHLVINQACLEKADLDSRHMFCTCHVPDNKFFLKNIQIKSWLSTLWNKQKVQKWEQRVCTIKCTLLMTWFDSWLIISPTCDNLYRHRPECMALHDIEQFCGTVYQYICNYILCMLFCSFMESLTDEVSSSLMICFVLFMRRWPLPWPDPVPRPPSYGLWVEPPSLHAPISAPH